MEPNTLKSSSGAKLTVPRDEASGFLKPELNTCLKIYKFFASRIYIYIYILIFLKIQKFLCFTMLKTKKRKKKQGKS